MEIIRCGMIASEKLAARDKMMLVSVTLRPRTAFKNAQYSYRIVKRIV